MNRSSFAAALLALLSFTATGYAQDDEYIVLDQRADDFDRWQERVDLSYGTTVISRETNVPVVVLEEQRTRTHLGYGGLMIANALALETGRSFDEIIALRSSGYGWGRIARENNVNLGRVVSRLDRADGDFREVKIKKGEGEKANEEKADAIGNKHSRGKGQSKGKAEKRGDGKGEGEGDGNGRGKGKGKHK